ncbi:MAG: hypothetical protein HC888_10815 [Candidatus Competibacteraceae bacterium]|nr:hypothetical protein [Candidatus Competibacteraceae bacterium]
MPSIPTSTASNGIFLSAGVAEGDFLTEDDGSSLFGEAASPTLAGHTRIDRPSFRWVLPPDEPGVAGELVEGIAEVVDRDGTRLTAITENQPAFVDFYASGIPFKAVAETDGPFGGLYYFTADAPVAGGGTADARLNLANTDAYPLGTLKLRAGVSGRVGLEIVDYTIWGDSDSYFEQVSSLSEVALGEGFGSVWFVRLIDSGATDHVPTVVYEITFDVAIGDGCVFDALDASWRLNVSGDTFEPVDVTSGSVTFRTTVHLGDAWATPPLPIVYSRDMPELNPLLFAPNGGSEVFELQMNVVNPNFGLDGLDVNVMIDASGVRLKTLRTNLAFPAGAPRGSAIDFMADLDTSPDVRIDVAANATFPELICETGEGEGEGEGEGQVTPGPHSADQDGNSVISLSELLRVIQFYNSTGYGCEPGTEDGFAPNDPGQTCTPHSSDYSPQNWIIALSELLRVIQFYNIGGYQGCVEGEDGFCPGL